MANKKYCLIMAEYNQWMNVKLYDICRSLTDEVRKKDSKAFFKSIHGTLNHLLWADRVWMGRFTKKEYPLSKSSVDLYENFEELKTARQQMDGDILQWASNLNDEWLDGTISFESKMYQRMFTLPTRIAVMQLFNHQTHHRGQITTLLSQLGIDYGATDLPVMPGVEKWG